MDFSKIIFVLVVLIAIYFARQAEKRNSKGALYFMLLLIILASGLRGESCGIDTANYYYSISNDFPYSWAYEEVGFRFICRFLMNLFNNEIIIFLFFAAITHSLVALRLWDFRNICSFSYMIFLYLMIYYIPSMNIMRQICSVAIVFYATKFLENNKFIKFSIALVLATTIHQASLLGLVFLVYYFAIYVVSNRKRVLLVIPLGIVSVLGVIFVFYYEASHINNYLSISNITDFNTILIYEMLCVLIVLFLEKNKKIVLLGRNSQKFIINVERLTLKNPVTIFYILGLVVSVLGMYFKYMNRLGYFYLIFGIVFWGWAARRKSSRFYVTMSTVFAIYTFAMELAFNGSGVFPYYIQFSH